MMMMMMKLPLLDTLSALQADHEQLLCRQKRAACTLLYMAATTIQTQEP
jgi:hypothetical protein